MVTSVPNLHLSDGTHHHAATLRHRLDLDEARRVQELLFPHTLPHLPGWDLAAAYRPARIVAGDYCDVVDLGDGQLAFALGDVSGKGLGPALVMAGLRALVHASLPPQRTDLAALMRELNLYLFATTPDDMFVTLFLAVLDVGTGQLHYVNAGHVPPLVLGSFDSEPMRFAVSGPVLGIQTGAVHEEHQVNLRPGSLLAVFSDGVTEALDRHGRMFHQRRLVEALAEGSHDTAAQTMNQILHAVERFTEGAEPTDDLSIILLRRDLC
jgi:serine phosphatase RsbU (regulator of sigma subunit)